MRLSSAIFILAVSLPCLGGVPTHQAKVIQGHGFEGAILSPFMLKESGGRCSPMGLNATWTPPVALILRAERALPAEIQKLTRESRRPNLSRGWTAKNGTSLNLVDGAPDLIPDHGSDTDFVYAVAPHLIKYTRQYVGATVRGKKVLIMNFFCDPGHAYLPDWKERWVVVLDGGDDFWRVIYDPATGGFSDWESNGT